MSIVGLALLRAVANLGVALIGWLLRERGTLSYVALWLGVLGVLASLGLSVQSYLNNEDLRAKANAAMHSLGGGI
jgi:hypothetical protein